MTEGIYYNYGDDILYSKLPMRERFRIARSDAALCLANC